MYWVFLHNKVVIIIIIIVRSTHLRLVLFLFSFYVVHLRVYPVNSYISASFLSP